MKKAIFALFGLLILCAHSLYLKTDNYLLESHQKSELYLFNGTFDKSENIITRDRIVNSKISGPDYSFIPQKSDWYDQNNVTYLRFKSGKAGTYTAGVSTLPRTIELSAKDFNEYLRHDGVADVLEQRKKEKELDQDVREKYSKHVKAILQVADRQTDHYKEKLGYPIEFIPLENPYAAKTGDDLAFRLLKDDQPLKNQLVYYSFRSDHKKPQEGHSHSDEQSVRTDSKGKFSVNIDHQGVWYLRTIHMTKSPEENINYESNWATLTFEIRKE